MMERKKVDTAFQRDLPDLLGALQEMDGGDLTQDTYQKAMEGMVKKPMDLSIFETALRARERSQNE